MLHEMLANDAVVLFAPTPVQWSAASLETTEIRGMAPGKNRLHTCLIISLWQRIHQL